MRFNLFDSKKFLNYLGEMDKDKLSESQIHGLKAVIRSLTIQLKNQYEISDPDDERAIELLGNLNKIIKEYEKIGLSELVVDLSRYSEVANKKYLREYLLVERGNLLAEVGGQNFGPSKWHTDNTEERYRKQYWGNALRIAEMIGKNKNAREFQGKVIQHLKESLKWAKRDLVKNQGDEIKGRTENYKIIIDEIYEKLEELE